MHEDKELTAIKDSFMKEKGKIPFGVGPQGQPAIAEEQEDLDGKIKILEDAEERLRDAQKQLGTGKSRSEEFEEKDKVATAYAQLQNVKKNYQKFLDERNKKK